MSEPISFTSDGYVLEGALTEKSSLEAVIITHPHPLYGGDMNNLIVDLIEQRFVNAGYSTLRFNFRGAGESEGIYDNGIGEMNDLISAHGYLQENGYNVIHGAGYSFGAWVIMNAVTQKNVFKRIYLVSPPVSFMTFNDCAAASNLSFVVMGDQDDFAELNEARHVIDRLNPNTKTEIIKGADHFYFGYTDQLIRVLQTNIINISDV